MNVSPLSVGLQGPHLAALVTETDPRLLRKSRCSHGETATERSNEKNVEILARLPEVAPPT